MAYEIFFIDVGDADAILISYQENPKTPRRIVLVDAGNVGDEEVIKHYLFEKFHSHYIDYAICTHPDKDHKGGFFGLFEDKDIEIGSFYIKCPWDYLTTSDLKNVHSDVEIFEIARNVFNHPQDEKKNLIDIVFRHCQHIYSIYDGMKIGDIPMSVVGPSEQYYRQVVLSMVENFAEVTDEADFEKYDENAQIDEYDARSVIDEDDDDSPTNKASVMLLFTPGVEKFLLLGDATCASIKEAINRYGKILSNCFIKVPHHGSKHNMNTDIIASLNPKSAVISAKGSRKHPNSGLVYWLSKYCNVYSTHKSNGYLWRSDRPLLYPAIPLKKKM